MKTNELSISNISIPNILRKIMINLNKYINVKKILLRYFNLLSLFTVS